MVYTLTTETKDIPAQKLVLKNIHLLWLKDIQNTAWATAVSATHWRNYKEAEKIKFQVIKNCHEI